MRRDDPEAGPSPPVAILSPGNAVDGFPARIDDPSADALLAAWTALWHPALLSTLRVLPQVVWSESLPARLDHWSIVVPRGIAGHLWVFSDEREMAPVHSGPPADLVRSLGATVIELEDADRPVVDQLASHWNVNLPVGSDDFVGDLQALGYATLQIERLSSLLRFATHFDRGQLEQRVFETVAQITARNEAAARESLGACFAALMDSRHHFYPVEIYLVDWSLLPPGSSSKAMQQFPDGHPLRNLWLTGTQLRHLAAHDPSALDRMRTAMDEGTLHLLGMEASELTWPLLPADAAVRSVTAGVATAQEILGRRPAVFARRRHGMTPRVPMMLQQLGYQGVIHATLDEGKFPAQVQPRTQWYGPDCSCIDALAAIPIDANGSRFFLRLASYLRGTIDRDYVATVCLANWLGSANRWYRVLQHCCRHADVLGKFVSCQSYLQQTSAMGQHGDFSFDDYTTPYLRQAVGGQHPDPISRWQRLWQRLARLETAATFATWSLACRPASAKAARSLHDSIQCAADQLTAAEGVDVEIDDQALCDQAARLLLKGLGAFPTSDRPLQRMYLNPTLRNRRVSGVSQSPVESEAIYAAHTLTDRRCQFTLDLPGGGFALIPTSPGAGNAWPAGFRQQQTSLASIVTENILSNDFIRVRIDPGSGGLAGFWLQGDSTNRLSQRLVAVRPDERLDVGRHAAARMIADDILIAENSPLVGIIVTRGRVVNELGEAELEFNQRFELWRGMRYVSLRIQLQPVRLPRGAPWTDYIASRFRWSDQATDVRCIAHDMFFKTQSRRFDAPLGFQVATENHQTAIWTQGLPYHRRTADHECDSLLVTAGETARCFELALAADPVSPLLDARSILLPPLSYAAGSMSPSRGWLFHCDARHVLASHWRPLWHDGHAIGVAVRLSESADRSATARLRCARPWHSACKTDFLGNIQAQCPVEEGVVQLTLAPREWTDLHCYW